MSSRKKKQGRPGNSDDVNDSGGREMDIEGRNPSIVLNLTGHLPG